MNILLEILYEDDAILVVNKPAGLLTQAPRGIDSLEWRIKDYLHSDYLGVPHRLDRPTSGVMVFGKRNSTTHRLSQQFEKRTSEKTYWACLEGTLSEPAGTWRDFMRKLPDLPRAVIAPPIHPDAREAILHFRVLQHVLWQNFAATLVEIQLETGRMHQIRLQAASRGFPIIGDLFYGATRLFKAELNNDYENNSSDEVAAKLNAERERPIALHARSITFDHPKSRERMTFVAEVDAAWSF